MMLRYEDMMPVIRAALERGDHIRMTVFGASMLPFLRSGDMVELEPLTSLPSVGDLVYVRWGDDRYLLHRVVQVRGDIFFLRGDAHRLGEGPFTREDIVGRLTVAVRGGRSRNLGRGAWRVAGLAWIRCFPVGYWLLRLAMHLKKCLHMTGSDTCPSAKVFLLNILQGKR